MHRTQILLEEDQYRRLRDLAERSGRSIGDLVRRAVDEQYGGSRLGELQSALRASRGAWSERDLDGAAYVDALRPGLGERLAQWE